jgi:hypothetical protein
MLRLQFLALALLVAAPMFAYKKPDHDWKTGKVLDSAAAKTYVEAGAKLSMRDTDLMIRGDEYSYVVEDTVMKNGSVNPAHGIITRSLANRKHGCRFVIADDVKYYQDKTTLHVIDADGKECKLEVLRQERLAKR